MSEMMNVIIVLVITRVTIDNMFSKTKEDWFAPILSFLWALTDWSRFAPNTYTLRGIKAQTY